MFKNNWHEKLWGNQAKLSYLLLAAGVLLLSFLGGRELWTQEHRWADIVSAMFYSHDFLHPSLNGVEYYDKPLLSYWLIAGIAWVFGGLSTWALRLPSALAGILAIWSIYSLGKNLKNRELGLAAGWLLLTTYYFLFWARTSSADMLNMAGTLFAVSWYFSKKAEDHFINYVIFFLILGLTALCKGLVGPVVALLAIIPDLLHKKNWHKYLRLKIIIAALPALVIYALPFWLSAHFGSHAGYHYQENGLYLVYRENVLRYFQPFDHKGPIYTYFIFLPVYLLPWTIFFIPALFSIKKRWQTMPTHSRWLVWCITILFLFFTLSGSRRNYYILPMVPFALLFTADWLVMALQAVKLNKYAGNLVILFLIIFFINFNLLQSLICSAGGMRDFSSQLISDATKVKPWSQWKIVLLDPESKIRFYLQLPPTTPLYTVTGARDRQSVASLLQAWPFLKNPDSSAIYITRKAYQPLMQVILKNYHSIVSSNAWHTKYLFQSNIADTPVAFIPN